MNHALSHLASHCGLGEPQKEPLRLAFGLACALRIRHLLEDDGALRCLSVLEAFVGGTLGRPEMEAATQEITGIASRHRGSASIDGSAHAAVSATYAVANALAGRALDAAGYAAYAAVYAYGGYAVTDPTAFDGEFAWQVDKLRELAGRQAGRAV